MASTAEDRIIGGQVEVPPSSPSSMASPNSQLEGPAPGNPPRSSRGPRNQKACDACRSRKVKCLYSTGVVQCKGCIFLDIACTHNRPRRKRGPPNKTQLLARGTSRTAGGVQVPELQPVPEIHGSHAPQPESTLEWSPPVPAFTAMTSASPTAHGPVPMLEPPRGALLSQFAPREVLDRVLDAWFNQVHALAPVLFRRPFLQRFNAGDGDRDPIFCALVVTVCAATVATLRREGFDSITISSCRDFLQRHHLLTPSLDPCWRYSVDWCIAMYNMSTSLLAVPPPEQNDMVMFNTWAQGAAGVRYLAYYHMHDLSLMEQEQIKRLFWLQFVASTSSDCHGRLMPNPLSHQDNLQQLQLSVLTDEEILDDIATSPETIMSGSPSGSLGARTWHGRGVSYVPGLQSLTQLYRVWHDAQMTNADAVHGQSEQALAEYQDRIQHIIDSLPPELRWRGGLSRPLYVTQGHESQTVNIFISSLHVRSCLLQMRKTRVPSCTGEHQRIIDDLLEILYHLPARVFHANGLSLMPKTRGIGAAYLEEMQGEVQTEAVVRRMERLSRKLSDLDCWSDVAQVTTTPVGG